MIKEYQEVYDRLIKIDWTKEGIRAKQKNGDDIYYEIYKEKPQFSCNKEDNFFNITGKYEDIGLEYGKIEKSEEKHLSPNCRGWIWDLVPIDEINKEITLWKLEENN